MRTAAQRLHRPRPPWVEAFAHVSLGSKLIALFSDDVVNAGLRPAVDVLPAVLVSNTVALVCNVDEVGLRASLTERVTHRVVCLFVRDYDHTVRVGFLNCNSRSRTTEVRSTVRLRTLDTLGESEPTTSWDKCFTLGERVDYHVLAGFAKQHCECRSRVHALQVRLARDCHVHRAGDVDKQNGLTRQLLVSLKALEHCRLKVRLELRSPLRRRDETERQNTLGVHLRECLLDDSVGHTRLLHVAQVTDDCQTTKLFLADEALPRCLLICTSRQCDFPCVRRLKALEILVQRTVRIRYVELRVLRCLRQTILVHKLREHQTSFLVLRLTVDEEHYVAQLDVLVAIVLRKLVLGELVECCRKSLLYLLRERALTAAQLVVDRHELSDFVGTLNDASERIPNEFLVLLGSQGHFINDEQWCVTKLLLFTSLDRQLCALLRRNLANQLTHQRCYVLTVRIESVFPQHASVEQAGKLCDCADTNGCSALGGLDCGLCCLSCGVD